MSGMQGPRPYLAGVLSFCLYALLCSAQRLRGLSVRALRQEDDPGQTAVSLRRIGGIAQFIQLGPF